MFHHASPFSAKFETLLHFHSTSLRHSSVLCQECDNSVLFQLGDLKKYVFQYNSMIKHSIWVGFDGFGRVLRALVQEMAIQLQH
jgi:hypothetical protein